MKNRSEFVFILQDAILFIDHAAWGGIKQDQNVTYSYMDYLFDWHESWGLPTGGKYVVLHG